MKFSERYELTKEQSELDFVDITIGRDIPLFIDPYIFSLSDSDWDLDCHQHVISFFQSAIDYIRTGEKESAKSILNGLSEPNETHLGLSIGRPSGRGVSGKQALDIYNALVNSEAVRTDKP